MFERIVVGYDGEQAGRDALRLAVVLGHATGGRLTIVFPYVPLLGSEPADQVEHRIRDEAGALLAGFDVALPEYRWSPSPWPIHALHELAEYAQAQLIVFGAAREGMAAHMHVSLMERMVHGAPCAVAVAPAGYAERDAVALRRLGVGFADSSEGRAALRVAQKLAGLTGGELRAIAGSGLDPALVSHGSLSSLMPVIEDELFDETQAQLTAAVDELPSRVRPRVEAFRGDPADVLLERSHDLDLLVLGSRAYGPLCHLLLGSVSAPVMRGARCPVVVVPRAVAERG